MQANDREIAHAERITALEVNQITLQDSLAKCLEKIEVIASALKETALMQAEGQAEAVDITLATKHDLKGLEGKLALTDNNIKWLWWTMVTGFGGCVIGFSVLGSMIMSLTRMVAKAHGL